MACCTQVACNHKTILQPDPSSLQLFEINSRGTEVQTACDSAFPAAGCVRGRRALSLVCGVLREILEGRTECVLIAVPTTLASNEHSNSHTFGLENALDAY